MATVWGGVHAQLGTAVAFKFLRTDAHALRESLRFLDEARALARMNHPGIVKIYDAGLCPPELAEFVGLRPRTPYFVMEAVAGGTLEGDRVVNWNEARRVLLALLDALAHAHARDVLHRDIKPSNILFDEFDVMRLTDFGIARLTRRKPVSDHVTGTPSYMAPEQITAQVAREGPWTDLYAIGCLAYWLVTGSPPFEGTVSQILSGHVDGEPDPPAAQFRVPGEFESWCLKLLEKDPQGRFTRAADAAVALARMGSPGSEEAGAQVPSGPVSERTAATATFGRLTVETRLPAGAAGSSEAPDPPGDWRLPEVPVRGQLLSSGPGMLTYRHPMLRGREEQRTQLWDTLLEVWSQGIDRSVALVGPPGIGRSALQRWFGRRGHETGSLHVLRFKSDVRSSAIEHLVDWWNEVGERPGALAYYAQFGGLDELAEWDLEQIGKLTAGTPISGAALSAVHARWTWRLSYERVVLFVGEGEELAAHFQAARTIAPGRRLLVVSEEEDTGQFDQTIPVGPMPTEQIEALVLDLLGLSRRAARELASRAEGNPGAATAWAKYTAQKELLDQTPSGLDVPEEVLDQLTGGEAGRWAAAVGELSRPVLRCARLAALADVEVSDTEFDAICRRAGSATELVIGELARSGLVIAEDDGVRFSHPAARRAVLETPDDPAQHEMLHDVFRTLATSIRNRRVAAYHGFRCNRLDIDNVLRTARQMRANARVKEALKLLDQVVDADPGPEASRRLHLEIAECQLNQQNHTAAREALDEIPPTDETEDVRALRLYLAFRRLEDVQDELLAIDPAHLSETACRMVAYTWMDLGEFDRAKQTLLAMDATYDPPGRLYAFARLHFLQEEWNEAERFGLMAARRFLETGVPGGALAANDIVASSRLELGERAEATEIYRRNLAEARRHGLPAYVQRYNLAVCLLKGEELTEEVDLLLEEAVKEAIQRGRRDLEHCSRAARALYAVRVGNETLAHHRVDALAEIEPGPWLQSDSADLLEKAYDAAPGSLAPKLRELLVAVRQVLK